MRKKNKLEACKKFSAWSKTWQILYCDSIFTYREFRCLEAKIEESKKASSCWELNTGHLACGASALPLSYNNRTDNHQSSQSSICTLNSLYSNKRQDF